MVNKLNSETGCNWGGDTAKPALLMFKKVGWATVTQVSSCIYFPGLPVKQPIKGKSIFPFLFLLGGGRKDKVLSRAAGRWICLLCWTALKATFHSLPVPKVIHRQCLESCQVSQDLLMLSAAEASRNPQILWDVLQGLWAAPLPHQLCGNLILRRMPFLSGNGRVNRMCPRAWLISPSCLGFSLCSREDNLAACLQNAAVLHPVKRLSFKLLGEHQPSFIMSAVIHGTATACSFLRTSPPFCLKENKSTLKLLLPWDCFFVLNPHKYPLGCSKGIFSLFHGCRKRSWPIIRDFGSAIMS